MGRRFAVLVGVTVALACSCGVASAAATGPAPVAAPVVGSDGATLSVAPVPREVGGSLDAAVSGTRWAVRGSVSLYVPGQTVTISVFLGDTLARSATVPITAPSGAFSASFDVRGHGTLTVQASHAASAGQELLVSDPVSLTLVRSLLRPGERGLAVRVLQTELRREHYVVGARGVYDARTMRAVLAFRKLTDMARTSLANGAVFRALAAGRGRFVVRYPHQGRHVEGDLTHQVLALIGADGRVQRIYPMSSGKPSTPTQPGNFRVWLRSPGTNSDGMVDSSFFNRGDAIHGYHSVPPYAASHGCLRVPIPDALSIYDWIAGTGVPVDVYFR